jgi:hypothetical protein
MNSRPLPALSKMADFRVGISEFLLQETWRFFFPKIKTFPALSDRTIPPLPLEPDSSASTIKLLALYIINMKLLL